MLVRRGTILIAPEVGQRWFIEGKEYECVECRNTPSTQQRFKLAGHRSIVRTNPARLELVFNEVLPPNEARTVVTVRED